MKRKRQRLQKAQHRFDKVRKNGEQFKLHFERSPTRRGKFRTRLSIVRGKKHYNGRGLVHRAVGQRHRIEGDAPSITRTLNSLDPRTQKGKIIKRSAQAVNFMAHGGGKTAVNTALTAETVGIKASDTAKREVVNSLKQKYSREAVDDYNRGTLETLRIGADAVKGTHHHFKQKKQFKLEKAKYRLKKAEYDVFKEDKFKPKIKSNRSDLKSAKADFKQHKQNYKSGSKSNIQKAFMIRRKQDFKATKCEIKFDSKKLKSEKKFKSKELKNQKKIFQHSKTGLLAMKPVGYSSDRMKASAWQKAVNEDTDNDMLHAADSVKRRAVQPVAQKVSKPEKLHREQTKRERLKDKNAKSNKKLNRQENRLKIKHDRCNKHRKKTKQKKSIAERFKDISKIFKEFVKNIYESEVKKFFASVAVPVVIIFLVFALIIMIFSSISGSGNFVLGTYPAQDYDLSEAVKYYSKLAWDMNEKLLKVSDESDWKNGLAELGADRNELRDKPREWFWGRSSVFNYDPDYDFDVYKLWSFLCAYYYDFDAADNGDIRYWRYNGETEDILKEIFDAEYEFEYFYDNSSRWVEYYSYKFEGGIDGSYWLVDSNTVYHDSFKPRSNPGDLERFKDDNGYLHFDIDLEILDAQHDYSRTGWYIQDQRYFVNDSSGQSSPPFYSWYYNREYGRTYGGNYHPRSYWGWSADDQIYWCVSPQDTVYWRSDLDGSCLISYYQRNYWETDCRLYYNVRQKKTFDEVITEKLRSMSHSDERVAYYDLLSGKDGENLHGNHQTLHFLLSGSVNDSTVLNGYGYDMQSWNSRHCGLSGLHEGIDVKCAENSDIYSPFKCKIKSYDSSKNTVILRKDDVEYWYDGTGGTKRDTEVIITNVLLNDGHSVGDTIADGEVFAHSTGYRHCDVENGSFDSYIHIQIETDTDGIGWDFIDPRLILY